jgi:hypothetical protein
MQSKIDTKREELPRFFQVGYRVGEADYQTIYAVEAFAKKNGLSRNKAITSLLETALNIKK